MCLERDDKLRLNVTNDLSVPHVLYFYKEYDTSLWAHIRCTELPFFVLSFEDQLHISSFCSTYINGTDIVLQVAYDFV